MKKRRGHFVSEGASVPSRILAGLRSRQPHDGLTGAFGIEVYNPMSDSWIPIPIRKVDREDALESCLRLEAVDVQARVFEVREVEKAA